MKGYGARAILARQITILMARKIGQYRNKEIADFFDFDKRTASYNYLSIVNKLEKNDVYFNMPVRNITRNIFKKVLEKLNEDADYDQASIEISKAKLRAEESEEPKIA